VNIKNNKKLIVTQSNKLIEARYALSVGEQKIILLLISTISPEDKELKNYEMKVSDFAQMMGLKGHSIYERLNTSLDKLLSRVLHIPTDKGFLKIGWVSSAEYIKQEGLIFLSFDKKLKPYLLQLKEQFTKYDLFIVTRFQSTYSVRIYMLLKQYQTIGHREFDVIELRHILDIDDHKYPLFKDFRKWVLNKAKKELETKNKKTKRYNSDISFNLETIRTGRKITRLRFIIKKQACENEFSSDFPEIEMLEASERTPALEALAKHNVKGKIARNYINIQGEEEVLLTVALFEEKKAVGKVKTSGAGLLITLLNNRAGEDVEVRLENKIPSIPNITDGTQLQNWAIANNLPAAPAGLDTFQYRQMLYNKVEKMRMAQERDMSGK
jgi:plasmid replication initiation protein